jgi:hypothetical protein
MATSVASFLDRRIDSSSLPLAVGDVLVIGLLLTIGTINHTTVDFVLGNPLYLAGTLAPFYIGWLLVAPLVGAYSAGAAESAKASVPLAVRSWVGADIVGVLLRATPVFHGGAELTFLVVTMAVGIVGLGLWRYLVFKVW